MLQLCLADRDGQVSACLLQNRAGGVGGAAQAAGHGIGEIDRDEQRVDIVHLLQVDLALRNAVAAQLIQHIAAQLTDGFPQAVEVGGPVDRQFGSQGQRLIAGQRQKRRGLGELLLGILHKARVENILVLAQIGSDLAQQPASLVQQPTGGGKILAVSCANTIGAGAYSRTRARECSLAGGVFLVQICDGLLSHKLKVARHVPVPFSTCTECTTGPGTVNGRAERVSLL